MKVVAVVPIKMNNSRTPGKNTKLFSDGTPLINCIQKTLLNVDLIDEIYVYCSSEEICNYIINNVNYIKRDDKFDSADTNVIEMMNAFSKKVDADIYVQAHATTPFLSANSISNAISQIIYQDYDSAFTVAKLQDFLWHEHRPLNYSLDKIPRTQDMDAFWIETTGLYVYSKYVIQNLHRRIGNNPFMVEVSEIEAIDIDTPLDFEIADAVYSKIINKK